MNEPKLTGKAAQRLLEEISHQIELDKMIDEILPMSDEEVTEIEAMMASIPPSTQEEIESTNRMIEDFRAWREENYPPQG